MGSLHSPPPQEEDVIYSIKLLPFPFPQSYPSLKIIFSFANSSPGTHFFLWKPSILNNAWSLLVVASWDDARFLIKPLRPSNLLGWVLFFYTTVPVYWHFPNGVPSFPPLCFSSCFPLFLLSLFLLLTYFQGKAQMPGFCGGSKDN